MHSNSMMLTEKQQNNFDRITGWSTFFQNLLEDNGFRSNGIDRPDLEDLILQSTETDPLDLELYLDLIFKDDDFVFSRHFKALPYKVLLAHVCQEKKDPNNYNQRGQL